MATDELDKLRKKVDYSRGLRKIRAEAELVEYLVPVDNEEALALARDSAERARELLRKAQERNTQTGPYALNLAWALRSLAYALRARRSYAEAEILLAESMEFFRRADNGPQLIRCRQLLHLLYRDQDRYRDALAALDMALELARQSGYHNEDAALYGGRGTLLMLMGEFPAAIAALEQGLAIARERDDRFIEIVILSDLGGCYEDYGVPAKAADNYRLAVDMEREYELIGTLNLLNLLWNLARLIYTRGDSAQAIEILHEAITPARSARYTVQAAFMLAVCARLHIRNAAYRAALDCNRQARALYRQAAHRAGVAWCLAQCGVVYYHCGLPETARQYWEQSCSALAALEPGHSTGRDELLNTVAILAEYRAAGFDAAAYLARLSGMEAIAGLGATALLHLGARHSIGLLYECTGDTAAALAEYRSILTACRKHGFRYLAAKVLLHCVRLLHDRGDYYTALEYLEEAFRQAESCAYLSIVRQLHILAISAKEQTGQEQEALLHYKMLYHLERKIHSPALIIALEEQNRQGEQEGLRREHSATVNELAETRAKLGATQRLLEVRHTRIGHLTESLQRLSDALRPHEKESAEEYRARLYEERNTIATLAAQDSWKEFEQEVEEQDNDFAGRLARNYPALTTMERKVCALIRLNNTSHELSRLLNISTRSVQAYRYRIRKKFGIDADVDLNAYILEL